MISTFTFLLGTLQDLLNEITLAENSFIPFQTFDYIHGFFRDLPTAQATDETAAGQFRPPAPFNAIVEEFPELLSGPGNIFTETGKNILRILAVIVPFTSQHGMPGVRVLFESSHASNQPGADWIQVDIPDKLQQIRLFLAKNRFVTILKKLSVPSMPMVKSDGIAGEKTPHDGGDGCSACPQKKMEMIGYESPNETGGGGIKQNSAEPLPKTVAVLIVVEYALPLDSPANDVVQRTWGIYASFAWHTARIAPRLAMINL